MRYTVTGRVDPAGDAEVKLTFTNTDLELGFIMSIEEAQKLIAALGDGVGQAAIALASEVSPVHGYRLPMGVLEAMRKK